MQSPSINVDACAHSARVVVLIPAYLEQGKIAKVIAGSLKILPRVLVVDDGSPDATAEEATAAGAEVLRHEKNQGKGAALQTAFRHLLKTEFDFVVCLDGDGQHAPEEICRFVEAAERDPSPRLVVGNRMEDTSRMPLVRRGVNRWMSQKVGALCGQSIPDTQCGFRMIHRELLPLLFLKSNAYDYESEMLLVISKAGYRIDSVPVSTIYAGEKSKIHPVRDTLRFFKLLKRYKGL